MNELHVSCQGKSIDLAPGQVAILGRGQVSTISIEDPRVSREQVRLSFSGASWVFENIGKSPAYMAGSPVTSQMINAPCDIQLGGSDGPIINLIPAVPQVNQNNVVSSPEGSPQFPGQTTLPPPPGQQQFQPPYQQQQQYPTPPGQYPPGMAQQPYPGFVPGGQPFNPGQFPQGQFPQGQFPQGHFPQGMQPQYQGYYPGAQPATPGHSGQEVTKEIISIFFPISSWLKNKKLFELPRILVAVYGLAPIAFLAIFLSGSSSGATLGQFSWAFSLFFAPLWAIIFWYIIKPGKITSKGYGYIAIVLVAEIILWGGAGHSIVASLERGTGIKSLSNPFLDLISPGIIEEGTKLLPVLILALMNTKNKEFSVKFWMFLGSISGIMAGTLEAQGYIASSVVNFPVTVTTNTGQMVNANIAGVDITGLFLVAFRSLDDAFSHSIWVAISASFVGLAIFFPRRRIQLIVGGLLIPVVLHALNDYFTSLNSTIGSYLWLAVQAFSVFMFLSYTVSIISIERSVKHSALFRGQSMYMDEPSIANDPQEE